MQVTAQPIDAAAFAPFGQVISTPLEAGRRSYTDDLSHDERRAALSTSHVEASASPVEVATLERHPHSSQTFLPLDVHRWLIVVANSAEPAAVRAFVVGPGVGVTLRRGVWHHRLTALDEPGRFAVLMWKDGTTDDDYVAIERLEVIVPTEAPDTPDEVVSPTGRPAATDGPARDLVGYGRQPPDPRWPNGARLAVNFVLNVEEGSEPSVHDGDGYTENRLTDASVPLGSDRDLAAEGLFEYGSRVGFWRVHRAFQERGVPLTLFACALALERNPEIAAAIVGAGNDVCSHGYRWVNHRTMGEAEEREQIALAVESFGRTLGYQPAGWYCRYGPSPRTRRLLVEHGGFIYDSDAYNDDLPYWVHVDGTDHLVVPYSLTTNDAKLFTMGGSPWAEFILDGLGVLRREGADRPAMLSIGLHPRIVGQPARFAGLERVLDHLASLEDVWITSRRSIAEHWITTHPPT
jgi:peptidoglycan/xylan/chitin deacetylase (PgdA/CDA1 family)/ureidoglycolate hydrolase